MSYDSSLFHKSIGLTSFNMYITMMQNVQDVFYLVWKMFCTIFLGDSKAADSNSCISSELSFQPRAPKFSSTCLIDLTPGIGIVPFVMHQFIATCKFISLVSTTNKCSFHWLEIHKYSTTWDTVFRLVCAICLRDSKRGSSPGSICRNRNPL